MKFLVNIGKRKCWVFFRCLESFQSTLKLQVIVTLQIGANNKMELSAQTRSMTVRLLHFQMKFGIILVPAFISIIVKHQTRIICTNWPTPPQYNGGANHPIQMKSVVIKCDFICIMRANQEKAYPWKQGCVLDDVSCFSIEFSIRISLKKTWSR